MKILKAPHTRANYKTIFIYYENTKLYLFIMKIQNYIYLYVFFKCSA